MKALLSLHKTAMNAYITDSKSPMMAYYYREYVSNEGLLLQRVSLQWRLTITESKSPMKAYYYRE